MNNDISCKDDIPLQPSWGIKDCAKVLLFYILMAFAGTPVLFRIIKYVFGQDLLDRIGVNLIFVILSVILNTSCCLYIFYIVRAEYKLPLITLGLTFTNWKINIPAALKKYLIAIPFFFLAGIITNITCKLIGLVPKQQDIAKQFLEEKSTTVLITMIIFGAVIAPIVEEIIFRGFLQTALKKHFGRLKAILFSSFFFRLST